MRDLQDALVRELEAQVNRETQLSARAVGSIGLVTVIVSLVIGLKPAGVHLPLLLLVAYVLTTVLGLLAVVGRSVVVPEASKLEDIGAAHWPTTTLSSILSDALSKAVHINRDRIQGEMSIYFFAHLASVALTITLSIYYLVRF